MAKKAKKESPKTTGKVIPFPKPVSLPGPDTGKSSKGSKQRHGKKPDEFGFDFLMGSPRMVEHALRMDVQNCQNEIGPGLLCPKTWDELIATDNPSRRYCNTCRHHVHRARTRLELKWRKWLGQCVAYGPDA